MDGDWSTEMGPLGHLVDQSRERDDTDPGYGHLTRPLACMPQWPGLGAKDCAQQPFRSLYLVTEVAMRGCHRG